MMEEPRKPIAVIIDDEIQIRRLLSITFEENGFEAILAETGQAGINAVIERPPDIVILDLGLPDMDGLALLRQIREWSEVPIIILTANDLDENKVRGLDSGADDYLTKPFSIRELLARVRAAQRHSSNKHATDEGVVFLSSSVEVTLATRSITAHGRTVKLTPTEFALLKILIRHAGRVVTHPQLIKGVWGANCLGRVNYLHVYITHLREKIEENPAQPKLIITESRVGYYLVKRF